MAILQAALFPALVVLLALAMLVGHWRAWGSLDPDDASAEGAFFRRRLRRRTQASGTILLVGLALFGGQFISPERRPTLFVFFWFAVMLLVLWVVVLAIWDFLDTRRVLSRLKTERRVQTAKLEAELKRAQDQMREASTTQRNGQPDDGGG